MSSSAKISPHFRIWLHKRPARKNLFSQAGLLNGPHAKIGYFHVGLARRLACKNFNRPPSTLKIAKSPSFLSAPPSFSLLIISLISQRRGGELREHDSWNMLA